MSEVKTDKLTGVSTAKTVTVTVGATATQSLEQGLAKLRCRFDQAAETLASGDLNVSSVTDFSTAGLFTVGVTSAFNDALYSISGMSSSNGSGNVIGILTKKNAQDDYSTTAIPCASGLASNSFADVDRNSIIVFGDLA